MKNQLTKEQSLEIITRMIAETKHNFRAGGSFFLLLWGWVVAICNFGHYFLEVFGYPMPYIVWLLVIPAAIATVMKSRTIGSKMVVKTHLDRIYNHIWIACSIGIAIVLVFMHEINMHHNPVILLLAGVGTYMTGIILRFKPIIFGAFALWLAGLVAFLIPGHEQNLLAGIAIIVGYLLPGYLLKKTERG